MSIFFLIKEGWSLLTLRQRYGLFLILFVFLISSFLELFSLSLAFPFVSLLLDPDGVLSNEYISVLSEYNPIGGDESLIVFVGALFVVFLIVALIINVFALSLVEWFGVRVAVSLSGKMIPAILKAPYVWFLNQNSSILAKRVYDDPYVVGVGLYPSFMELTYTLLLIIISGVVIVYISPWQSIFSI